MRRQEPRHLPGCFARYFAIDDRLFSGPMYLTGAGRAVIPPNESYPPPGHPDLSEFPWQDGRVLPEFSLLWVDNGEGVWDTSDGVFPIRAGDVGRVYSGRWHRYRPAPATGWTENWIQFTGRLAHEMTRAGYWDPSHPVCTPARPACFARQFQDFQSDLRSPDFVNDTAQGMRILGLLGLLDHAPADVATHATGLVDEARLFIWSHSHRQLNVPWVAAQLGVSRRTLERAFADAGHAGVLDEINRCRLNRAERLLRETQLPIQNIVSLAGFGTAEQMRLNFQEKHQVSPAQYRKGFLGNRPVITATISNPTNSPAAG